MRGEAVGHMVTRYSGMRSSRLGTRRTDAQVETGEIPYLEDQFRVAAEGDFALIGDAPKNYLISRGQGEALAYIAKAPRREGPIECVTEYLIARIGASLPLRIAEGRLVRLRSKGTSGDDVRFLSRQFLDRNLGEQLVHGAQLVTGCFGMRDEDLDREVPRGQEWSFYTVDLVDEVLLSSALSGEFQQLRAAFCRMMAFDAIVGANPSVPSWARHGPCLQLV
jgi:hypothetical protein